MRKAFTFFSVLDSKLFILVEDGDTPSLPSNIPREGRELSKRDGVSAFFIYEDNTPKILNLKWRELCTISHFSNNDGAIVCEGLGELFPLFTNETSILPNLFLKKDFNHTEATFFGGSFNPWHEGHSECLRRCPKTNIVIIPDRNPWKEEIQLDCFFASFMELARKFENTRYSIYPGFYGREKANPTVDWLPKSSFLRKSLLIGDDNFCSFLKWNKVEELIINLDEIYVLNRNHSELEINDSAQDILAIKDSVKITILGEHDFMSLSSTELREKK